MLMFIVYVHYALGPDFVTFFISSFTIYSYILFLNLSCALGANLDILEEKYN